MFSFLVPDFYSWEGNIFFGILGFSWATFVWEEYLSFRQRRVYIEKIDPPKELDKIIDKETYEKARVYGLDKSRFSFVQDVFNQVLNTGVMVFGIIPALWKISEIVINEIPISKENEVVQTLTFVMMSSAISFVIGIPWAAYSTFKIEQKHGFNKQTPWFFVKDNIKKFFVSELISAPVVAGIVYIIKSGGDYFFLYLWGFATAIMLFFMTIYPDYIAPLFDKYTPLPEGELKTGIEALASEIEFPLTKLYVVEGSKRSAHSNAYFYGFFNNKRIVLYDTLLEDYTPLNSENEPQNKGDKDENKEDETEEIEEKSQDIAEKIEESDAKSKGEDSDGGLSEGSQEIGEEEDGESKKKKKTGCNNEEVLAVLAHELGHWKKNHVGKNIAIAQVNMFLMFSAFGLLYQYSPLYRAFGFHHSQPAFIGLMLVTQFVFAPYSQVLEFFMTMYSRHNEFQADRFAVELKRGEKLIDSLIKLNNDNLGFPVYDYLFSMWHHSHPPILERIQTIKEQLRKEE